MKKLPANAQKTYTSRGASTRQRIVDATVSLMYAKGVEGTSLDDVRAAAGVSKSQLYHYFADKDALVRDVISAQAAHVLAAQGTALTQLDSLAALRRWCDCILALNRGHANGGCPLGSLANELANKSERARALLVAGFNSWEDRLAEGFAKMRENGELGRSAVPRDLAIGVLSAVQGGLLLAKTSRSEGPLKVALDMAFDYVASQSRSRSGSSPSGVSTSARKRRR
jgi:TetR/AcrR family transcriptional regulator, transcriptional repressor for nem operon